MSHVTYNKSLVTQNISHITHTGWRRPIGCLKLQIIFRKRATKYVALLRKMTYREKTSCGSLPPCHTNDVSCHTDVIQMTQCVAVCCSVLQCVAVCCSVLQCDRWHFTMSYRYNKSHFTMSYRCHTHDITHTIDNKWHHTHNTTHTVQWVISNVTWVLARIEWVTLHTILSISRITYDMSLVTHNVSHSTHNESCHI